MLVALLFSRETRDVEVIELSREPAADPAA
jgi:hypothetical protein